MLDSAGGCRRATPYLAVAAIALLSSGCAVGGGVATTPEDLPLLEALLSGAMVPVGSRPVLDLTLDAEGRIYLVQETERTVRVLDWDGQLLDPIGRGEDGVLQMSLPQELGWEGELLWVFDRARYQLHLFRGGELLESVSFPSFDVVGWEFPFIAVGAAPGKKAIALPLIPLWVEGGRAEMPYPVVLAEPGGPILDTLWVESVGSKEFEVLWPGGGGTAPVPQPFSDDPVREFVWSDSTMVELRHELEPDPLIVVERRRMDGSIVYQTRIAFEPNELTEDEITRAVELLAGGWAEIRRENEEEIRALFRDALHTPTLRRPYQTVVVSEEGGIWIRMTPTADQLGGDADGSLWLTLSAEGIPEARVELPSPFVPMWIDGSRVVGVTTDDSGEHAVAEVLLSGPPDANS